MRLLKRCNGILKYHIFEDDIPKYAVLSHTWGEDQDEVAFGELEREDKPGFAKLTFILDRAREDELEYVWIDTCCINKHNYTELGEAIHLMYKWYANAAACYVYLSDVPESRFRDSKWFSRGWTLQELMAPSIVKFFDGQCRFLGCKKELSVPIREATGIPIDALLGKQVSVAERYRWSISRKTRRPEDKSYCMGGLLGVSLIFNGYGLGAEHAQEQLFEAVRDRYGRITLDELRGCGSEVRQQTQEPYITRPLRQSLQFSTMASGRDAITRHTGATGTWLFSHPVYRQWLHLESTGLLWIKGHPGAGKSTLMRLIDHSIRELKLPGTTSASFFFNARGHKIERSTAGMYRSLLVQMLDDNSDLEDKLCAPLKTKPSSASLWSLKQLKIMFKAAVMQLRRVVCLIDALDEGSVSDVQDMLDFFQELARGFPRRFCVCVASRYYPAVSIKHSIELCLDEQKHHMYDIETYVKDRLDTDDETLRNAITSKANGVFLWAAFALDTINPKLVNGDMVGAQAVIRSLPGELGRMYKEIVEQEDGNVLTFQLCIQLILFSKKPMAGLELYYMLLYDIGIATTTSCCRSQPTHQDLQRFVATSSRGLAKLVIGSPSMVQFAHESIKEYFIRTSEIRRGLDDLFPFASHDIEAWSHSRISDICCRYITASQSHLQDAATYVKRCDKEDWPMEAEHEDRLDWCSKQGLPLLRYAVTEIIYHAEQAAGFQSQDHFVERFNFSALFRMYSILSLNKDSISNQSTTAVSAFAMNDAVQLMATAARLGHDTDLISDGLSPICIAVRHGAIATMQQLLMYGARVEWRGLQGDAPIRCAIHGWRSNMSCVEQRVWRPPNAKFSKGYSKSTDMQTAVILPWTGNSVDMVRMMLSYGSGANQRAPDGNPILIEACYMQEPDLVDCLLEYGVRVDDRSTYTAATTLITACHTATEDSLKIVRSLLRCKADVNLVTKTGITALMAICSGPQADIERQVEIARLLITYGAKVDLANSDGETALMIACKASNQILIRLLLENGASLTPMDSMQRTALVLLCRPSDEVVVRHLAISHSESQHATSQEREECRKYRQCRDAETLRCRHTDTLEVLLEYGVDMNVRDSKGRTALQILQVWEQECVQIMVQQPSRGEDECGSVFMCGWRMWTCCKSTEIINAYSQRSKRQRRA